MRTYFIKFKGSLDLHGVIAGNVIDAIAAAIQLVPGQTILNVDMATEKHLVTGYLNNEQ